MQTEPRRGPRAVLWLALLAVHLAVLHQMTIRPIHPRPDSSQRQVIRVTLIAERQRQQTLATQSTQSTPHGPPAAEPAQPSPKAGANPVAPPSPIHSRPPATAPVAATKRPAGQPSDPETQPPDSTQHAVQADKPATEPALDTAGAPPVSGSLLTSEATRRAIRQAARAPVLAERAASASQDPGRETAQQRLGREVAQTAYGNCLKGEYPGSGMGLLSLPFYLAAQASGKCRK